MSKKNTYLIVLFLIVASCAAFGRIAGNDFINFDDDIYITGNNHIKSGINSESIKWAFTSVVAGNWHPLTMLSHALDWSLFGANPAGHHLVSLLLHIGAVVFLFLFLNKTTNNIWPSAFAAALFALHPLRVESVAWAAERKDVLSMFFGIVCLYAYAFYAESSKLSRYCLCLTFFVLSLMSKPMLVTLPLVLLLLDYWPLGRFQKIPATVEVPIAATKKTDKKKLQKRKADSIPEKKVSSPPQSHSSKISSLLWEKAPFLLLTIAFSITAIWAQKKDDILVTLDQLPFIEGLKNAIASCVSYLVKIFWPVDLAIFYPFEYSLPLWKVLISGIILILITLSVLYYIKKLPFLFVGWFWYLGTLVPVIGLVKVGNQAMADRYTYLPSIGIAIILLWGISLLFPHEDRRKKLLFPVGIAVLVILAALTWHQCGYWKNSLELFNHTVLVTKNNVVANNSRGNAYFNLGRYQQAINDYNEVIRLKPDYGKVYNNRGNAYAKLGLYEQAVNDYSQAILLKPGYAKSYYNRGFVYSIYLGQYQRAIDDLNAAIRMEPDHADYYLSRGVTYFNQGNKESGCVDFQKACELGNCKMLERARNKGNCR